MMPLALNVSDATEPEFKRSYLGGMDLDRYADLSSSQIAHFGVHEVRYELAREKNWSTLQSAKEIYVELLKEYSSRMRFTADIWSNLDAFDAEPLVAPPRYRWLDNVNNLRADESICAISETITSLFETIDPENIEPINAALSYVNVECANPHHVISILRSLFRMRDSLPQWGILQNAFRRELKQRKANGTFPHEVEIVMRGLADDE